MMITRDNYEPFFLDYLEGNLEENMIDQFLDFLEKNPDLKEELHLFENIHIPEEQVVYSGKEQLYKSVQDEKSAFEIKSVAYMEGDLKDEERKSFEAYLANHPELQKEYNLFAKTRLVADTGIKYPAKQKLYRKSGTTIVMNWVARAAAVIVILWGIGSLLKTEDQTKPPTSIQQIAAVKPALVNPVKKSEPAIKIQEPKIEEKLANNVKPKPSTIRKQTEVRQEESPNTNAVYPERDAANLEEIVPLLAQLETGPIEGQLAVSHSINPEKINDPRNIMTVDEFLANRAKKVGNEGLLSVQRILRTGLSVASELSGERIDYKVKNGKISSVGFESKLMAFSIPLQKK
jgi:hypothetical protein